MEDKHTLEGKPEPVELLVPASPSWAWLETLLLTAGAAALSLWLRPEDPLLIESPFSWPLIVVALLSVRYGVLHGLVSVTVLVGLTSGWSHGLEGTPTSYFVGLLALAGVCGAFRDLWTRRLEALRESTAYHRTRLERFARSYHLLRASHDRLEHQLVVRAPSLREALTELRQALNPITSGRSGLAGHASSILELFAGYGHVRVASLHALAEDRTPGTTLATLGGARDATDDPLLAACARSAQMMTVREPDDGAPSSRLFAAIPIVDAEGRLHGVVGIQELELGIQPRSEENLKLLGVLGAHVGDLLGPIRSELDTSAPSDVLDAVSRELKRGAELGVPSSVVLAPLDASGADALTSRLREGARGLDRQWLLSDRSGRGRILLLLPLTGAEALPGFLERLRSLCGLSDTEATSDVRSWTVDDIDRFHEVMDALRRECGLDEDLGMGVARPRLVTGGAGVGVTSPC